MYVIGFSGVKVVKVLVKFFLLVVIRVVNNGVKVLFTAVGIIGLTLVLCLFTDSFGLETVVIV